MRKIDLFVPFSIILAFAASVPAQSGGTITITQSVIASGGGTSGGGTVNITGTTGQTLAGTSSTGAQFKVQGGFWQNSSASNVSVSGRVLTFGGRGVRGAVVSLTDQLNVTRQVHTGPYGAYRFDNVLSGQTYTISVMSRRFQFTSQMISVNDDITGLNFVASP